MGSSCQWEWGLCGAIKSSEVDDDDCCTTLKTLKTEFYILKVHIFWYVNFIIVS